MEARMHSRLPPLLSLSQRISIAALVFPMTSSRSLKSAPFFLPGIGNRIFNEEYGLKDMIWFIAGALRQSESRALTVQEICASIEVYQPWRISECRGADKIKAAENNIRWILSRSPAFQHDPSGRWSLTGNPLVRTADLLPLEVMTERELQAYLAWGEQLFAPFKSDPIVTGWSDRAISCISEF